MYRPIPNKLTKQFPEITGLSDFHKLIVTVMKSYSPKRIPNIVTYKECTNFDKDKFIDEISFNLTKHNLEELTFEAFISMFKTVFEKHATVKKKYLTANHSKFLTKELSKAVMLRSKLRKRFLKDITEESRCKYKKQKAKKDYYENIEISSLTDSNKFWKRWSQFLVVK